MQRGQIYGYYGKVNNAVKWYLPGFYNGEVHPNTNEIMSRLVKFPVVTDDWIRFNKGNEIVFRNI